MKKLLAILALLVSCPLWAASLVGTPTYFVTSGNQSYTVISTSNQVYVCYMTGAGENLNTPTATSWTFTSVFGGQLGSPSNTTLNCWAATPPSTGAATISCTTQFGDPPHGMIFEFSGVTTTVDAHLSAATSGVTANPVSGALTTANTDTVISMILGPQDYTPGASYTNVSAATCVSNNDCFEYQTGVGAGTPAPPFVGSAGATWYIASFAIKESGGGGPTTVPQVSVIKPGL